MRWLRTKRPRRTGRRANACQVRLAIENLEMRALMSVDLVNVMDGTDANNSSCGCTPPDPSGAAGPTDVIETVNSAIAIYDKASGNLLSRQALRNIFSPLGNVQSLSDPVIMYDDVYNQFVVGVLDYGSNLSRFDLAVSNDSDPMDGFYVQRYDMQDGVGSFDFADYPKAGLNADAYVFSFNMFPSTGPFHVDTLSVDKSDLTGYLNIVPGNHATMTPANMHASNPGDPMWFVESDQGNSSAMHVVEMTDVLTNAPTYTVTDVPVPQYNTNAPNPSQPTGGAIRLSPDDGRVFNAAFFGGLLVAGHTVTSNGLPAAAWYEFDTTTDAPSLVQTGTIDQGPGVGTYFPTIEINYEYDLGMTFMESSPSEYLSMYVTGQSYVDYGSGAMQTPVQAIAGTSSYSSPRIGDYSGISVDPSDGYTFWAVNEYKGSAGWNTGIAGFGVSPDDGGGGDAPIGLGNPIAEPAAGLSIIGTATPITAIQPFGGLEVRNFGMSPSPAPTPEPQDVPATAVGAVADGPASDLSGGLLPDAGWL